MTPEQEIIRANRAREAQENPVIAEALDHFEQVITDQWKNSPLRDAEGREKLRLMLEAQKQFREYLNNCIETGKLAKVQSESKGVLSRMFGSN
jgi:hypothetical protein